MIQPTDLDTPLVTVAMANHNGAPFIGEAVRSVLGQSLGELELVLVDDASTDDSLARARAAAAGDPRLIVEALDRNLGPGGARNRALALARGRWFAVVDSDDVLAPHRLERLLALAGARQADLVADNLTLFSGARDLGPLLNGPAWSGPREIRLAEFVDANRVYDSGVQLGVLKPLIARAALARTGLVYDETLRIGEDYDLVAGLLARGARYWVDPEPMYHYRKHAHSISHRLRRSDIEALLAADDRFCRQTGGVSPGFEPAALAALKRRRRSLERALVFDGMVAAIKARAPLRAAGFALAAPGALPLLLMPVAARFARLRGAT